MNLNLTWSWILSIAVGLLGIGIMVVVHELGHFIAAKACHISVQTLQFGFGPAFIKWGKGETEYRIAVVPFGGLCRMRGQDDLKNAISQKKKHIETCEDGSIWSVSAIKRIIVYLAGPFFNMLFAFLCYTILLSINTVEPFSSTKIVLASDYPSLYGIEECSAQKAGLKTGDVVLAVDGQEVTTYDELQTLLAEKKGNQSVVITAQSGSYTVEPTDGMFGILPFKEPVVGYVSPDTPEKKAGLKAGDTIVEINGNAVTNMFDLLVASTSSTYISMTVQRGDKLVELGFENPTDSLNFTLLQQTRTVAGMNFFEALKISGQECFTNFADSVVSLAKVVGGKAQAHETLGGTLAASESMGMLTTKGFAAGFNTGIRIVLFLLASVSISLCVANLLPIPALDGGLVLLSFAELITGHTFNPKLYLAMQILGILFIVAIFVLLTFF